jgi:hypothetical protein
MEVKRTLQACLSLNALAIPEPVGRSRKHSRWENTIESVTYTIISPGWETVKLVGALKPPYFYLTQMQMKGG